MPKTGITVVFSIKKLIMADNKNKIGKPIALKTSEEYELAIGQRNLT